jgi:multidrug efflux system outer membrane protein
MKVVLRIGVPLLCSALLQACSLAPRYERPKAPVPAAWPTGDAYAKAEAAAVLQDYRQVVRDVRLAEVIGLALANNRDLRVAAANVVAARARYGVQRGDLLPRITAGAQVQHANPAADGRSSVGGINNAVADVGVTAFELDLFGRVRSLSRAALNRYLETEAGARATRIALIGDVANAWFGYAANRSLVQIAESTASNARRGTELTNARLQRGIAPRSDLRLAQTILEQALADLASAHTEVARSYNTLQFLVGQPLEERLLPDAIDELQDSVAAVPPGLDTAVLLHRPDVEQAEFELIAANAEIGAARAALFPRISLGALVGFAGPRWSDLFSSASRSDSSSAGASLPIFTGGAALAGLRQVKAQRDAAVAGYERAVQRAFREVADCLARDGTIRDQHDAQGQLVEAAADAYRISEARYQGGVESYLQTLDSQRSLYNAERGLVQVRLTRATNLMNLFRALGGES